MKNYRGKSEYITEDLVEKYDAKRFHSIVGKIKNRNDWRALSKALRVLPQGASILNIPCGTGRFFPELMDAGFPMVAVDISRQMLTYAREKYGDNEGKISYGIFDIENLPYRDKTVGCAVVFRFMHLINDPETRVRVLKELKRVTKDWLIVSIHHKYTVKYGVDYLRGKTHKSKLSYRQIKQMTDDAGVEIVRIFPTGYPFSSNWVLLLKP